jgi:hypothetical protein
MPDAVDNWPEYTEHSHGKKHRAKIHQAPAALKFD